MVNHRNDKPLTFALIGCALLAASLASRAEEPRSAAARATPSHVRSTPCESARLADWYQRQRELTDGNADPFKQAMVPAGCAVSAKLEAPKTAQR